MEKKRGIFFITLIILVFFSFSFVSSQNFGYNLLEPPPCIGNEVRVASGNCVVVTDALANNTANVNSSQFWITNIGALGDVNTTQFSNNGGFLNIIESWVRSLASNPFDQDLNTTSNVIFGNLTILNNLSVDGNTFFVDHINNSVGIGTTSPRVGLHVFKSGTVGTPAAFSGTVAIFQDSDDTFTGIVIQGDTQSTLMFADDEQLDAGEIRYAHNVNLMQFHASSDSFSTFVISNSEFIGNDAGQTVIDFRVE